MAENPNHPTPTEASEKGPPSNVQEWAASAARMGMDPTEPFPADLQTRLVQPPRAYLTQADLPDDMKARKDDTQQTLQSLMQLTGLGDRAV